MNASSSFESRFYGPFTSDWTITELLDWIRADDARCHDERLAGVLDAAARAVGAEPLAPGVGVVARVRLLASRVAVDAAAGERTLVPMVAGQGATSEARTGEEARVLVRA